MSDPPDRADKAEPSDPRRLTDEKARPARPETKRSDGEPAASTGGSAQGRRPLFGR